MVVTARQRESERFCAARNAPFHQLSAACRVHENGLSCTFICLLFFMLDLKSPSLASLPGHWLTRASCPKSSENPSIPLTQTSENHWGKYNNSGAPDVWRFPWQSWTSPVPSLSSICCFNMIWGSRCLLVPSSERCFTGIRDPRVLQHPLNLLANPGQPLLMEQLRTGCKSQLSGSQLSRQGGTLSLASPLLSSP